MSSATTELAPVRALSLADCADEFVLVSVFCRWLEIFTTPSRFLTSSSYQNLSLLHLEPGQARRRRTREVAASGPSFFEWVLLEKGRRVAEKYRELHFF